MYLVLLYLEALYAKSGRCFRLLTTCEYVPVYCLTSKHSMRRLDAAFVNLRLVHHTLLSGTYSVAATESCCLPPSVLCRAWVVVLFCLRHEAALYESFKYDTMILY